jgi:RHS repeat-associated protein
MTKGPLSGGMADFVFDSRNRLVQAGDTVYRYDAENQRIGVNQTQYVINSQDALSQVLVKTEVDGTQTYYVYGLGLIGQESNGKYLSYHFDFRGSTVALTDENAQVTERFQYSPYGVLLSGDASITPFLFNGMYGVMTDGNGLYYMRARFYSPKIKRFVNQDVLLGTVSEGQTLNRYAFVTGQPVSFVDPFGLAKVHYWKAKKNPTKTAAGHISMHLEDGTYISYWPENGSGFDTNRIPDYIKDITDEGYWPYTIQVNGLDEITIKKWWENKKSGLYHFMFSNCADTVENAIQQGGMPLRNRFPRTPPNLLFDIFDDVCSISPEICSKPSDFIP